MADEASSVRDRVFNHVDTTANRELRTERGIAAILDLDTEEVRWAMKDLEEECRIKPERRKGGLETWRTYNTPQSAG